MTTSLHFPDHRCFWLDHWSRLIEEDQNEDGCDLIGSDGFVSSVPLALAANTSSYVKSLLSSATEDRVALLLPDFSSSCLRQLARLLMAGRVEGLESHHKEELTNLCSVLNLSNVVPEESGESGSVSSVIDEIDAYYSAEEDDRNDGEGPDEEGQDLDISGSVSPEPPAGLPVKLEENLATAKAKRRLEEDQDAEENNESKKTRAVTTKRVLMSHLDRSDLTCKICGKEFRALYKLKIHALIHSSEFPFACSVCGKGFNNKYKMRAHEKKAGCQAKGEMKTKAVSCERCGENFGGKTALARHLSEVHPDYKRHLCSSCGKRFKGQRGLDRHTNSVCSNEGRKTARSHATEHGQYNQLNQEWRCPHCLTVCSSSKALKIHGRVAHMEGGEEALPYVCIICQKRFVKKSYLEEHQNRFHSMVKQFACTFCPKRCSTKQDLDRHLVSHTGQALFQCSFCPRSFVHRASFKQHQRAHLGQRPYKCLPCGRSFGLRSVLLKHHKSHERKGDVTCIVRAPKGRRGCHSYIDFCNQNTQEDQKRGGEETISHEEPLQHERSPLPDPPAPLHPGEVYLSSEQYIQSSHHAPANQMQEQHLTDLSTYNEAMQDSRGGYIEQYGVSDHSIQMQSQGGLYYQHDMMVQHNMQGGQLHQCQQQPQTLIHHQGQQPIVGDGHQRITETESIAMDIMGLFSDPATQGTTQTPVPDALT